MCYFYHKITIVENGWETLLFVLYYYLEHYVCLWLCGIKTWNLKVRSLSFNI
jgi:hypothetical protein